MPTAKKAAAKPTTAVATKAAGAVSVKDAMAKALASLANKTQPATGNKIRVTQDKQFALPDGTKTREPLHLVIVDFCSRNMFYEGAFDKDNVQPPTCFAIGEIPTKLVPSDNSPVKQADSCAECPNNVFGSAGAGKACKNTRLLAVLPPDAKPEDPIWLLEVSPTAIKGFDGYVNGLASRMTLAPFSVVTTVSFDENKDYPSLTFGEPEPLDDAEPFVARIEEAQKMLAAEPDVSGYGQEKPVRAPTRGKPPARKPAVAARR
jgi:hypothetical protein